MNNLQENRIQMFSGVSFYVDEKKELAENVPHLLENSKTLKENTNEINLLSTFLKSNKKGLTAYKEEFKQELMDATSETACKMYAYAHYINNVQLLTDCNISKSYLRTTSSVSLVNIAHLIYDHAQKHLKDLGDYAINEETQAHLLSSINGFWESITRTNDLRNQRTQITQQIAQLFEKSKDLLKAMDMSMEVVRVSDPVFYAGYKKARRVREMGTTSLSVKGQVSDQLTGKPIKGATVTFTEINSDTKKKGNTVLVKTSASKGGFLVKNMARGNYSVTAEKNECIVEIPNLVITGNETQELNIQLLMN